MFLSRDVVGKEVIRYSFRCRCGSRDCKKVSYNGVVSSNFYEGYFMCVRCGTSLDDNGDILCYYSPNFQRFSEFVQLELF